ncbi:hypothetical protein BN903_233 [Halorubrum sp. AJ67]|nr:hypothetical protein BN903_233 [Halorubrum sp. AJ67]
MLLSRLLSTGDLAIDPPDCGGARLRAADRRRANTREVAGGSAAGCQRIFDSRWSRPTGATRREADEAGASAVVFAPLAAIPPLIASSPSKYPTYK